MVRVAWSVIGTRFKHPTTGSVYWTVLPHPLHAELPKRAQALTRPLSRARERAASNAPANQSQEVYLLGTSSARVREMQSIRASAFSLSLWERAGVRGFLH